MKIQELERKEETGTRKEKKKQELEKNKKQELERKEETGTRKEKRNRN